MELKDLMQEFYLIKKEIPSYRIGQFILRRLKIPLLKGTPFNSSDLWNTHQPSIAVSTLLNIANYFNTSIKELSENDKYKKDWYINHKR